MTFTMSQLSLLSHVLFSNNLQKLVLIVVFLEASPNCIEQQFLAIASVSIPRKVGFLYTENPLQKITRDTILEEVKAQHVDKYLLNKIFLKKNLKNKDLKLRWFKVSKKRLRTVLRDPSINSENTETQIHLPISMINVNSFEKIINLYKSASCLWIDKMKFCLAEVEANNEIGFIAGKSCHGEVPGQFMEPGMALEFYEYSGATTAKLPLQLICFIIGFFVLVNYVNN